MIIANTIIASGHLLHFILRPLIYLARIRRRPSIPSVRNPLLKVSATTLARRIRNGELTSQTVVEAYIGRIKEVNPFLNAVVEERFEAAVNDAKICDENLKSGNVTAATLEVEKPLYGVPITVKESCSLEGLSLTGGTKARRGMKAAKDGAAVEMLKNAGAIPLCVTNTPELCTGLHSTNFLHGSTKNPYDTRKSPGGSSGGEGALIGAGASILGIGSDILGSIRLPSFFNGIFGHKPTPGVIPSEGHFVDSRNTPLEYLFTFGPMARYVEDLHLAMKVLSAKCERPLNLDEPVDLKNLRVFYVKNIKSFCGIRSTTSDIRRSIKEAIQHMAVKGASIHRLSQEWVENSLMYMLSSFLDGNFPDILVDCHHPDRRMKRVVECLKAFFGLSNFTLHVTFFALLGEYHGFLPRSKAKHYEEMKENMRQRINKLLGDDGVFICPTYPHTSLWPELAVFEIDSVNYCAISNVLKLPSTHVPMGLNKDGMPIGFQVMAGYDQDRLCLAVARELEKVFGGWVPPAS
ncbi:fatty-acid amide hydrolase 2-B-like [Colletes latitarsis]|uniref:fatty-acid amide hydrolase 2-B-like n=1 Tax=Colletes latitarsis TaxID=2605962 RepID=UPI0040361609